MQVIIHPMMQCPAKFVGLFQEVLENTNFNNEFRNVFICVCISNDSRNTDTILMKEAQQWISTALAGHITFNDWLDETSDTSSRAYSNTCRKAWLEWIVSSEGHYVNE